MYRFLLKEIYVAVMSRDIIMQIIYLFMFCLACICHAASTIQFDSYNHDVFLNKDIPRACPRIGLQRPAFDKLEIVRFLQLPCDGDSAVLRMSVDIT